MKPLNEIQYFFRRKRDQFRNLRRWLPLVWNKYDFDYSSSIDMFKRALLDQAEFMESDRAVSVPAKDDAKRIRTVVRLMEKVYDDSYALEYQDKLRELYGDDVLGFSFEPSEFKDMNVLEWGYKSKVNADEIDKMHSKLLRESHAKQERAEELLWKLVAHNIRSWWD